MNGQNNTAARKIEADREYVISLRRYFHAHPELSAKEYNTAEKIEQELDKIGLAHVRVGETGVYSEIKGTKNGGGKAIVLRADTDALPVTEEHECSYKSLNDGVMHACGHDAHTAALIGAARVLASCKDEFSGTVRLCFQQGEEIGYGARKFIDGGYLNGAGRSVGIHLAPYIDVGKVGVTAGPNNASVDWFKINVRGKSAHISEPNSGVDAAYIMSLVVTRVKELLSLRADPTESVVVGIGKITAGVAYNVIAERAEAEGTLRVYLPKLRAKMKEKITQISEQTAKQHGGEASVEWRDFTSPLINSADASADVGKTAVGLFGAGNVITDLAPRLAGDDFAEFINKTGGVYVYVGSRNKDVPETCAPLHNCRFDIDERCLDAGVKVYVFSALDYLNF